MIDQSHNIEGKIAPMIFSVLNCQEAYAKSLIVPQSMLAEAQASGDVLAAHRILVETFRTDVRPLLAQVRSEMGSPVDPLAAYHASGYEGQIRKERGVAATSGGFQ
jgi:L-rhamnose isomerase/sugar isomerase